MHSSALIAWLIVDWRVFGAPQIVYPALFSDKVKFIGEAWHVQLPLMCALRTYRVKSDTQMFHRFIRLPGPDAAAAMLQLACALVWLESSNSQSARG